MSFLDNVMGSLGGEANLVGNVEKLASHLGNGGLEDIVNKLHQGGLGDVVKSWIGTGVNLPVNASQLTEALGSHHVSELTSALGINASSLASVLPAIIDHLTPKGELPSGDLTSALNGALKSSLVSGVLGNLFK